MKKKILISGSSMILVLLSIGYFILYDVTISPSFFKYVCKDFFFNITALANIQKKTDKLCKGTNGWLFYATEISATLLRWRFNDNNEKIISNLSSALGKNGIQAVIVPVPNKSDIYPEKYFSGNAQNSISRKRLNFINRFQNTNTLIIDCYPNFIKEKNKNLLYYPTDTHWNSAAKMIACEKIVGLLPPNKFKQLLPGTVRIADTVIWHPTDLLSNILDDTSQTLSRMTCVLDTVGQPLAKAKNAEVIIIGDSFAINDQAFGADFGSLLSYKLNTPIAKFCKVGIEGNDFFKFANQMIEKIEKMQQKPKVVIIVFSSRKLLRKIKI
jgi:hypothetical protein